MKKILLAAVIAMTSFAFANNAQASKRSGGDKNPAQFVSGHDMIIVYDMKENQFPKETERKAIAGLLERVSYKSLCGNPDTAEFIESGISIHYIYVSQSEAFHIEIDSCKDK